MVGGVAAQAAATVLSAVLGREENSILEVALLTCLRGHDCWRAMGWGLKRLARGNWGPG